MPEPIAYDVSEVARKPDIIVEETSDCAADSEVKYMMAEEVVNAGYKKYAPLGFSTLPST
jgi:hypothetical protein